MASSTGTGWAQLRQQTRSLETQVPYLARGKEVHVDSLAGWLAG